MDLDTLARRYLTARVARGELDPMTARNHRSVLVNLAAAYGNRPVEKLSRKHLEKWLGSRGHLKPSTRRSQLSYIRTFCAWLTEQGYVKRDPSLNLARVRQPRTVPRTISPDGVRATLESCPDTRARAIVAVAVWCGLRCGELSRIRVEDWDRRDEVLFVRGKACNEREVPMPSEAARVVDDYLTEHPATVGPLFRSYRDSSRALRPDTISGMVSEWLRAAGVKRASRDGVAAHTLRKTAASDVLDQCGDLRVVQAMLGHRNLSTTSVYLRRADLPQMRAAMQGRAYASPDATKAPTG